MAEYFCYVMDSKDRVRALKRCECGADGDAVLAAGKVLLDEPDIAKVEIWRGPRLVSQILRSR
jgi:hypothetical protein